MRPTSPAQRSPAHRGATLGSDLPGARSPNRQSTPKGSAVKSVLSKGSGLPASPQPLRSPRGSATKNIFGDAAINISHVLVPEPAPESNTDLYSVASDLKIYELFKNRPAQQKGANQIDEAFNAQRAAVCAELRRSAESIRDRFKKYLKYLTEDDVKHIQDSSRDNPEKYFIHFEKVADEQDKLRKKFKSVSQEDVRPVVPTNRNKPKGTIFPFKGPKRSEGGDDFLFRNPLRGDARALKRAAQGSPRTKIGKSHGPGIFDLREFIPREFVQPHKVVKLESILPSPAVVQETNNFNEVMLGYTDVVQIGFDGDAFKFNFASKPAIRDIMGILGSICQLLGVTAEDAQRIYEGCSLDIDDLKAYIGGNRKLLWTPLEDEALANALLDQRQFAKFYPILVAEKGEASVQKRMDYLKQRRVLKASPRPNF